MKKLKLFLLAIPFLVFACSKAKTTDKESSSNEISKEELNITSSRIYTEDGYMLIEGGDTSFVSNEEIQKKVAKNKWKNNWSIHGSTDPMTEESRYYLDSDIVGSVGYMEFPYDDVRSKLAFGCDGQDVWSYLWFSSINIKGGEYTYSGEGERYKFRVRFDDNVKSATMWKEVGSEFIHFTYDNWLVRNLKDTDQFMVELDWYGEGDVYFKYEVSNFSDAYKQLMEKCN